MFASFGFSIDASGQKISLTAAQPPLAVAVGIIWQQQQFLLTSRPKGKVYADYWEFPGGKVEANETSLEALARELKEELNISLVQAQPWKYLDVLYQHAFVRLYIYHVTEWRGELQPLEQQQYSWQQFPTSVKPILPGTIPILTALEQVIN